MGFALAMCHLFNALLWIDVALLKDTYLLPAYQPADLPASTSSVAAAMVAMAILIPNQRLTIPAWTQHQAGFLTTQT